MDGIILIDKPIGVTSHDVVDDIRTLAKTRRVGHAGTLDPFASGLLILGINKGTKMLPDLVGLDKTYEAVARLGVTSTTDDPEGTLTFNVMRADGVRPGLEEIESILTRFRGSYEQTAPAFSAKRIGGKKLYEMARRGGVGGIELPKKLVTISELEILDYTWPDLTFSVTCSSGTYIRALARDIGNALTCGAYLSDLRRTVIGPYEIEDATTLEMLSPDDLDSHLLHP